MLSHFIFIYHISFVAPGLRTKPVLKYYTVDAYFARPANNSSDEVIIIFSDIFGIFQNSKLKADSFAARGYLTIIPDLFNGGAATLEDYAAKRVHLPTWLQSHMPEHVDPIVEEVIAHLRGTLGVKKIAGVGYCYGARVRENWSCLCLRIGEQLANRGAYSTWLET